MLFVHAHPDDETITTGGTIAVLLDAQATVTLVTCTRGEAGEVVPPELRHLTGEDLGAYREHELAAAMRELGLEDFRFLGNPDALAPGTPPHRYRDSGMQWGPLGPEPLPARADATRNLESGPPTLTEADLDAIIADLVAVITDVQPTAVVSYDSAGGYGHPDHVRTHDAAGIAALTMGVPFYMIVDEGSESPGDVHVDVSGVMERKRRALREYRTQLTVQGDTIVHSGGQVEAIRDREVFRRFEEPGPLNLDWSHLGVFSKIMVSILALLAGSALGAVATANHQIAGASVSLALSAGLLAGLRLLFRTRLVAAITALALVIVVAVFSVTGPGGSVLIQANTFGYAWSFGLPAIAVIVIAWPRRSRGARDTMGTQTNPEKVVGTS